MGGRKGFEYLEMLENFDIIKNSQHLDTSSAIVWSEGNYLFSLNFGFLVYKMGKHNSFLGYYEDNS